MNSKRMPDYTGLSIDISDTEYHMMQMLDAQPAKGKPSQRDIAERLDVALGKVNKLVHALRDRGYLKGCDLTAEGKLQCELYGYRFFAVTMRHVNRYMNAIEKMLMNARSQGFSATHLVGRSDLAFLVQQAARRCGLAFVREQIAENGVRVGCTDTACPFTLIGEHENVSTVYNPEVGIVHLWTVISAVIREEIAGYTPGQS